MPERSIPAYAGEPTKGKQVDILSEVYPRVCGGTRVRGALRRGLRGLSPRMRGNRNPLAGFGESERSIPAYAGEPFLPLLHYCGQQVYPRVCGGT